MNPSALNSGDLPRKNTPQGPGFWVLTARGEPFRLLFPIGLLLGIAGIVLWPLYAVGWLAAYPAIAHPRIMIEGFLTSFVIGFLGTALPRMLDVPRVTLRETLLFGSLLIALTVSHLTGRTLWGDMLFLIAHGVLIAGMLLRLRVRRDTPPPGFVLVALGLLCAWTGAALSVAAQVASLPGWAYPLAPLLLYQGYLLLPIMGIGAFLLPRFFGLPNRNEFPESLALPPGWLAKAAFAGACGLAVLAGFGLEAAGAVRLGCGLRGAAVFFYFWREVPVHQAAFAKGTLAGTLRVALLAIPTGYGLIALWPSLRVAWLHVVFITGFNLLTFTVASRVVLGHSGQSHLFRASLRPVFIMALCLAGAVLARFAADVTPRDRTAHLAYAAIFWIAGALVWGRAILPSVRRADDE